MGTVKASTSMRTAAVTSLGLSGAFVPAAGVALLFREAVTPFLIPAGALAALGLLGLLVPHRDGGRVGPRGAAFIVVSTWALACVSGAVPFLLSGATTSIADAFFESASGFTTTGSSIFGDVETLPRSILFWRSLTHWLGGMGIIVLAVAVLPALGVSGFQMLRAEAPGPDVERLAPRIASTARTFWVIYVAITFLEVGFLLAGGMDAFDAVNHSFATLATGGFSTRSASVAAFDSPYIEWVITAFMLMSGVNFALYYRALTGHFRHIRENSELKAYIGVFVTAVIVVSVALLRSGVYPRAADALRYGAFQVATLMTSTGFATADYTLWPGLTQGVLLLMLLIGGCVGSTSGGVKMLHVVVSTKVAVRQVKMLAHPRAVLTIRVNNAPLDADAEKAIVGFIVLYFVTVILSTIVVAGGGADLETALSASLAAIGNVGPGFGRVGPALNFEFFPDYVKYALSVVMIVGRLEIYTVLLLLYPSFLRGW